MKILFTICIIALNAINLNAQDKAKSVRTAELKIRGNCESCKKRIENAADIKGVKNASWNEKTQLLTVIYREDKISLETIEKAIVSTGHDSEKLKAENNVYLKLPACCKYREGECTEKGK